MKIDTAYNAFLAGQQAAIDDRGDTPPADLCDVDLRASWLRGYHAFIDVVRFIRCATSNARNPLKRPR